MKNIILLSGPDKTKYFNEDISKIIKESISTPVNMVVIPADPDNYAKNDKQFNGNESVVGVFKTFKKIFPNLNILLLDNRVSLENGDFIELTPEHLVLTYNRGWVEAQELTIEDDIVTIDK